MQNRSYPLERILQCLRIDFDKLLVDASHNVIQFDEYELPHLNEWKIKLTVVLRFSIMLKNISPKNYNSVIIYSLSCPSKPYLSFFDILIFCYYFGLNVIFLVLVLLLCFVNVIIIYICVHIVFYRFVFICFSLLRYFSTSI